MIMRTVLIYIFLLMTYGCIEPFEPDFDLDTSNIVITGIITDLEPAQVEIAKSVLQSTKLSNVEHFSGATVILFDDQGNEEQLYEQKSGFYKGRSKGIVGRTYHINVYLSDNDIIVSAPQLLNPGSSIDNLSLEQMRFFKVFGKIKVDIIGLNLNLDMNNSDTLAKYYKWTVGGTYKRYTASGGGAPCYVTLPPNFHFVLGQSVSNTTNLLSKKLNFFTPNGKFAEGYSVEVTQFVLTKEAYDYWKKIDTQKNNVGSVFDPPPAQITSNLTYIDNQDISVIGFFEVSSAKTKRIFISPTDFPGLTNQSSQFSTRSINAKCFPPPGWGGGGFSTPRSCDDCSLLENSTKTKPPYWPE